MDETLVSELEAAIADAGALLVRAEKYRAAADVHGRERARKVLALGDTARRLQRRDSLDAAATRGLLDDALAIAARLRAFIASVRRT